MAAVRAVTYFNDVVCVGDWSFVESDVSEVSAVDEYACGTGEIGSDHH